MIIGYPALEQSVQGKTQGSMEDLDDDMPWDYNPSLPSAMVRTLISKASDGAISCGSQLPLQASTPMRCRKVQTSMHHSRRAAN